MKPIFFIHNQKCGGTSFASALKKCSIEFIPTSSINLVTKNSFFLDSLKCKPDTVIAGHPSHVKYNSHESAYQFFHHLYSNYKLIFPVRQPSRVLLSWVYYYNTRIQNYINNDCCEEFIGKKPYTSILKCDTKLLGMARHLSYSLGDKCLSKNGFEINVDNITEILIKFLKYCAFHVRGVSAHAPALNFTRNLVVPIEKINFLIQNSLPISPLIIDKLIDNLDICVYNCENSYHANYDHPVSAILGSHFVDVLANARENLSRYPNGKPPEYLDNDVDLFYEKLYPTEYQIFKYSLR